MPTDHAPSLHSRSGNVCPWWLCPTFDNPLRRLIHNPDRILAGLVQPGETALDIGCGIGYFAIPLARLVGPEGSVICVDLQEQMVAGVRRRERRRPRSACQPDPGEFRDVESRPVLSQVEALVGLQQG